MERKNTRDSWLPFRLGLGLLCAVGISACASGQVDAPGHTADSPLGLRAIHLPDDLEQALWWLPENTETILVSRGQVPAREWRDASPPEKRGGAPFLPSPQGWRYSKMEHRYEDLVAMRCIEPLVYYQRIYPPDTRDNLITTFYAPKSVRLFMKALCWVTSAGPDTCDIVLFGDNRAVPLVNALTKLRSTWRIEQGVTVFEVNLNQDFSTSGDNTGGYVLVPQKDDRRWIAAPRPDVYVCATSLDMIRVMIARMQQRAPTRALPVSLAEWQYVDPVWPAWGLRHYRVAPKPSSAQSMLQWDPEAVGLVFFGGKARSRIWD
ncbi:hypothetical protein [Thermopirellula anaerolimosa]